MAGMKDWLTAEKHEQMVAEWSGVAGTMFHDRRCAKLFQCWTCDALVSTTDWPPVFCQACRQEGLRQ
jgi:hypothetical protein